MPLTLSRFNPPDFNEPSSGLNDRVRFWFEYWKNYNQYSINFWRNTLTNIETLAQQPVGASPIAAADTIEPQQQIQLISGTGTINTINTVPDWVQLTLVSVDGFSLGNSGNIVVTKQTVAGESILLIKNLDNIKWYTLSKGAEFITHETLPLAHHGAANHGSLDQAGVVADGAVSSVSVTSPNPSAIATGDADSVAAADASDLATVITLANEIKADYNGAVTLINELKTVAAQVKTLVDELKSDQNTQVSNVNTNAISKLNSLMASMRTAGLLDT